MASGELETGRSEGGARNTPSECKLLFAAFTHNMDEVRQLLTDGTDVNCVDEETGLSPLHIAVGQNDLPLCKFLVEEGGARFFADKFGRWPSVVAIECHVDEDLADFINAKEYEFLLNERVQN